MQLVGPWLLITWTELHHILSAVASSIFYHWIQKKKCIYRNPQNILHVSFVWSTFLPPHLFPRDFFHWLHQFSRLPLRQASNQAGSPVWRTPITQRLLKCSWSTTSVDISWGYYGKVMEILGKFMGISWEINGHIMGIHYIHWIGLLDNNCRKLWIFQRNKGFLQIFPSTSPMTHTRKNTRSQFDPYGVWSEPQKLICWPMETTRER